MIERTRILSLKIKKKHIHYSRPYSFIKALTKVIF